MFKAICYSQRDAEGSPVFSAIKEITHSSPHKTCAPHHVMCSPHMSLLQAIFEPRNHGSLSTPGSYHSFLSNPSLVLTVLTGVPSVTHINTSEWGKRSGMLKNRRGWRLLMESRKIQTRGGGRTAVLKRRDEKISDIFWWIFLLIP